LIERNSEETKSDYAATLGQDFGEFFFHLDQSVVGLVSIWDVYRSLFGTNKERVYLLNAASGYVTRTFQDSLHERVILGICQVSDPPGSGSRKNVSVRGLPNYIVDPIRRDKIDRMLMDVEASTSFARDLRNKMIAHSDLSAATGSYVVDFSSRIKIVDAIKSIIVPLRYVHAEYFDAHKLYHPINEGTFGFLKCIFLGLAKRDEELQMLRSGEWQELLSRNLPEWITSDRPNDFD
jgi:hypothetical protein